MSKAVITLHPWWAMAVLTAKKRCENRTWLPRLEPGDWLYIHAGSRRPSRADRDLLASCCGPAGVDMAPLLEARGGAVIGRARYLGSDTAQLTPWDLPGWLHWRLGEVETIEPIRCSGQLGIWRLPDA